MFGCWLRICWRWVYPTSLWAVSGWRATATVFVRSGDRFVRAITTVREKNGAVAIGTELDPNGEPHKVLMAGRLYLGVALIFGDPYFAAYQPIRDGSGRVIGAFYTGYQIATLDEIGRTVRSTRILDHGFVALSDSNGHRHFQSAHVPARTIASVLGSPHVRTPGMEFTRWGFYQISRRRFIPWQTSIYTAK